MEIKARYVRIGLFTLAVILGGFLFVYWLHSSGSLRERTAYEIRFDSSVSGLLTGSAVLFNGIRVGEVTALTLGVQDPKQVTVTVAVEPATPIRADTRIEIDFQGLAGAAVISLRGGAKDAPPLPRQQGRPPLLIADAAATQSMTQAARETLRRLDGILAENAEPLRGTLASLNTFAAALARNSDRVDGIVAGLERMTGGAAKAPATLYELTAPRVFPPLEKAARGQLVLADPSAPVTLDTQKITVRKAGGEALTFADAQWADSVPKMLQAKLVHAFENSGYLDAVGRAMEGISGDYQLLVDIRAFQVSEEAPATAEIELTAKLLGGDGRIAATRIVHAKVPASPDTPRGAVAALDAAFAKVAVELVVWTADSMRPAPATKRP